MIGYRDGRQRAKVELQHEMTDRAKNAIKNTVRAELQAARTEIAQQLQAINGAVNTERDPETLLN